MKKRVIPRTRRGQISVVATFIALLFACGAEIKAIYSEVPQNDQRAAIKSKADSDKNDALTNDKVVELRCEDDQTMLLFIPDNSDAALDLFEKPAFHNVNINISGHASAKMLTISASTESEKVAGSEAQHLTTSPLIAGYLSSLCS